MILNNFMTMSQSVNAQRLFNIETKYKGQKKKYFSALGQKRPLSISGKSAKRFHVWHSSLKWKMNLSEYIENNHNKHNQVQVIINSIFNLEQYSFQLPTSNVLQIHDNISIRCDGIFRNNARIPFYKYTYILKPSYNLKCNKKSA